MEWVVRGVMVGDKEGADQRWTMWTCNMLMLTRYRSLRRIQFGRHGASALQVAQAAAKTWRRACARDLAAWHVVVRQLQAVQERRVKHVSALPPAYSIALLPAHVLCRRIAEFIANTGPAATLKFLVDHAR